MTNNPLEPISTQPPQAKDNILLDEFAKEIVKQGERLDDLTRALFSAELIIPGIYVAVLRLIIADKTAVMPFLIIITVLCWVAALSLTLYSLFPKKYDVMPNVVRRHATRYSTDKLSIEEFYENSAKTKRHYLVFSSIIFFFGIILAGLSLLI